MRTRAEVGLILVMPVARALQDVEKLMIFSSSKTKSCDTWWVSGKYALGIMGKKTRGAFQKANMYHGFSHFSVPPNTLQILF